MKLIDTTCPKCGVQLKVDADNAQAKCEFCGAGLLIDDEVQRLKVEGAEKADYDFEKGRQRAEAEAQQPVAVNYAEAPQQKKKHGVGWWIGMVLLWICFLPIMATIFVVRNQNLSRNAKIGIVAAIWVACILIYAVSPKDSSGTGSSIASSSVAASSSSASADAKTFGSKEDTVNKFVEQYNATHEVKITDTVMFDPHQEHETGGPYSRVAYRLGAFDNSVGLHGTLDSDTIDVVATGSGNLRVYVDQNDRDYERTLGYAHAVVDTFFAAAGYTVPSDKLSGYEEDWGRFDEGVRHSDYRYATNQRLHYNDFPVTADVSILSGQKGQIAELLVDLKA